MKNIIVKIQQHYKYIFHKEGMFDIYRLSEPFRTRIVDDLPFIPQIDSWIKIYDENETYENFPQKISHKVIDVCTSIPYDSTKEPYEITVTIAPVEVYFDLDSVLIRKIMKKYNFDSNSLFYGTNIDNKDFYKHIADTLFKELEHEKQLVKRQTDDHRKPE